MSGSSLSPKFHIVGLQRSKVICICVWWEALFNLYHCSICSVLSINITQSSSLLSCWIFSNIYYSTCSFLSTHLKQLSIMQHTLHICSAYACLRHASLFVTHSSGFHLSALVACIIYHTQRKIHCVDWFKRVT